MTRSRLQIDRFSGGRTTTQAITIDSVDDLGLTHAQRAAVDTQIESLKAEGFDLLLAAAALAEMMLDRKAYVREAQRRGVLPL